MKHAIVRPRPFAFTAAVAVALVGAASSLHATIVQNGLQAWFSADATSTVNGGSIANGGSVSAWANQGALGSAINVSASGSAQPIYVQNGIDRGGGVYQPVIRFNRDLGNTTTTVGSPNRMVTSGNTDLGIVNDSTWFIVFNPLVSNAQQGLFGLNSSANRFGAFYTGSTNQLRYMNFTDPDTVIQIGRAHV